MRMKRTLIAIAAASALLLGCSDDGGSTTDDKKDNTVADAGSSSGADGASGGGGDATSSSGGDAASSSGGGDAASGKKYNACPELGDCVLAACMKADFAADCEKACLAEAGDAAIQSSATLLTCTKDECMNKVCKDAKNKSDCVMECLPQKCGTGWLMCLNDKDAKGTKTCGDGFGCMDKCDVKDGKLFSCQAGCYNSLDAAGKKAFANLLKTVAEAGGDMEKAGVKGMIAMAQCLANGKEGDATCVDTLGCAAKCGGDDDGSPKDGDDDDDDAMMCITMCLAKATKAGTESFVEAIPCLSNMSGEKCDEKLLTCIDPKGPGKCADVYGCMSKCVPEKVKAGEKEDDATGKCTFECLGKTEKAEAATFFKMMTACDDDDDEPAPSPGGATKTDVGPTPVCAESLVKCAAAGQGKSTCAEMLTCVAACDSKGDDGIGVGNCGLGCASKASKEGADHFVKQQKCAHDCAAKCKSDKDPAACATKCWSDDKDCMAAKKACTP